MDTNALLVSVLTFVLPFQAVVSLPTSLFFRGGQEAILPCANASPHDTACSYVTWFYTMNYHHYLTVVNNGNVLSRLASRVSLDKTCSLVIKNITAEDAGFYICLQSWDPHQDESVLLNILTISPAPPDADPKRDEVTLGCSLWGHSILGPCPQHSLRWADETGAELLDEGVGHRFLNQTGCVSFLTVKRQSGLSRRYTCRFVEENRVKIEADYTPDFTDVSVDHTTTTTIITTTSTTIIIITSTIIIIIIGVVLVVMAVVLIRYRKRSKVTEDVPKPTQHPDEPESHLTYATVSHARQQASPHINVKEEEVTYSTVRTAAEDDVLYSVVSKPK